MPCWITLVVVMLLIPPIPMTLRTMAIVFIGLAVLGLLAGSANAGGEAAHLGGVLVGFLLVKYPRLVPGFGSVSMQAVRDGLTKGRWEKKQRNAAALEAEVDRILEKVRTKGLQSLSRKERKTLQRATDEQRRAG